MCSVACEVAGSRVYVTGNTYPIKDQLRSAGCHWDGDRRQWWIGKAKAAAVQAVIAGLSATSPQAAGESVPPAKQAEDPAQIKILGKAKYKGRVQHQTLAGMQRFVRDAQQAKTGDCPRCKQMMDAGKWATYNGSGDYDDCPLCGATVRITY
jgi:hypothetical protein